MFQSEICRVGLDFIHQESNGLWKLKLRDWKEGFVKSVEKESHFRGEAGCNIVMKDYEDFMCNNYLFTKRPVYQVNRVCFD